ncbi:hypothetical protein G6011_00503 [Alternaria panax]|uniref:Uncharacterized protein n=1 Tax=Alternaria panax TaxID=48097 RepID=A0AAD4NUT5_9PLEO|nr:hypothetical protein G6011_00503 [Alternaria panax]
MATEVNETQLLYCFDEILENVGEDALYQEGLQSRKIHRRNLAGDHMVPIRTTEMDDVAEIRSTITNSSPQGQSGIIPDGSFSSEDLEFKSYSDGSDDLEIVSTRHKLEDDDFDDENTEENVTLS